ncbi:MAG: hypothetical protein ACYTEQ_01640 [Planctomycetota bacterium]|jgi:hypothetical protein
MLKYIVTVCRIGYAFRDIKVEAHTAEEAKVTAEEIAGNYEYSESTSEYEAQEVKEA